MGDSCSVLPKKAIVDFTCLRRTVVLTRNSLRLMLSFRARVQKTRGSLRERSLMTSPALSRKSPRDEIPTIGAASLRVLPWLAVMSSANPEIGRVQP